MMNGSQRASMRTHGTMLGRILIGGLFVVTGMMAMLDGGAYIASTLSSKGLPFAGLLAILAIALKLGAGAALIVGYRVGLAAVLLIVFTLMATFVAHMSFQDPGFFKNFAIIGGLMYIMAYGAGEGWALNKQDHNQI